MVPLGFLVESFFEKTPRVDDDRETNTTGLYADFAPAPCLLPRLPRGRPDFFPGDVPAVPFQSEVSPPLT